METQVTTRPHAAQYSVVAARKEKHVARDAAYIARYVHAAKLSAGPFAVDEAEIARAIQEYQTKCHGCLYDFSRLAIAFHEVCHFVLSHLCGFVLLKCEINGRAFDSHGYCGYVDFYGRLDRDASAEYVAAWGRCTLAGPLAEMFFLKHDIKRRIGELMEARVCISRAAVLLGQDRDEAWSAAIVEVIETFRQKYSSIKDLSDILEAQGELPLDHKRVKAFLKDARLDQRFAGVAPDEDELKFVRALKTVPDVLKEARQ